ncbi:MAG TPA: PD-(D/E)XK nuclease family protein [Thermoanaerobaculia bacterium]|nr:PD-(D/E)XK nuclease family protein [Thermoanaerobaculia bacterium]
MAVQGNLFDERPFGEAVEERRPESVAVLPPALDPAARGRVLVAYGARAAEERLLAAVEALAAEAARDPRLLADPVRVVVPSRSLRAHVAERLVTRRGRSLAGVRVQTLHGLALEVLERVGGARDAATAGGEALFPVLVERAARREGALARGLDPLLDGYAAVAATVRDLLDAGLEAAHAEAALEALAADGAAAGSRQQVERAQALVRVAARTAAELERLGLARAGDVQRRAAEALGRDPDLLPARAVLVHGFAEVTGVAGDLLEGVLRARGGRLIVDLPPDPAALRPGAGGVGAVPLEGAFARRLLERMAGAAETERESAGTPPDAPVLRRRAAPGAETEARAAAAAVRALLDAGTPPERIGIVARDLAPYRLALRRHLGRAGVPFSGVGEAGPAGAPGRRARALIELLRRGEAAPSDRWLDAVARLGGRGEERGWRLTAARRADLRLALFALGAARLRDVADLDLERVLGDRDAYALPLRQGLSAAAAEAGVGNGDDAGEPEAQEPIAAWATRRRVPGDLLRAAVRAAGRLDRRLRDWPRRAPAAEHLDRLAALLADDLGWREDEDAEALAAVAALGAALPPGVQLAAEELRLVLRAPLDAVGRGALGGAGGGVQVLSVTEARGRTFDHLFLLGLNREEFPRPVREDPLLPDDLRAVLRRVLPDLAEKRGGFDEERYLFAQLLSASPAVTLSWQETDDDGRARSPSPLVERLPLAEGEGVERVQPPFAAPKPGAPAPPTPRPADEHATLVALHGPRARLGGVLAAAIAEARREYLAPGRDLPPVQLAAARMAVLDELDPDRRTAAGRARAAGLGPYFGFVGALPAAAAGAAPPDPRHRPLFVTHLERLAGCPWQFFTARLLGVERAPDPLAALPAVDARLLGNTVHRILARLAREAGAPAGGDPRAGEPAPAFAALAGGTPVPVPWPAPEALGRLVREEAEAALRDEGVPWRGLARVLADRALPLVERARSLDWGDAGLAVLGVELAGEVSVADAAGRPRPIAFRADRLDRGPDGALRLTDYKTGRPFDPGQKRDTARKRLLAAVREGKLLQAMAYERADPAGGARGRYLYLHAEAGAPELAMPEGDRELADLFAGTAASLLALWDAGSFFPRVVEPSGRQEPVRCKFCEVAEGCLRGDSGARRRLFEWSERAHAAMAAAGDAGTADESAALLGVWRLAAAVEEG